MAGAKNHDYHILPPSITPIMGSFSALIMFFGLVMWMHPEQFGYGSLIFGLGLIGVLYTFFAWWSDVVREAHAGDLAFRAALADLGVEAARERVEDVEAVQLGGGGEFLFGGFSWDDGGHGGRMKAEG